MPDSRGIMTDVTTRPLEGRRIVVTRASEQAGELCDGFTRLGAEVIACPAIAFAPVPDPTSLHDRLQEIDSFDWIVFTSSNGVRFFADALGDRPVPPATRIAVVGTSTAETATERLRVPDLIPDRFDAEHLLRALGGYSDGLDGVRMLLVQGEAASPALARGLAERGVRVDAVPVYRTVVGNPPESALRDVRGGADALTFTSPTTAVHFADLLGQDSDRVARHAAIICIGPVTADAVRRLGWPVDAVAEPRTARGLVDAVVGHFQSTV